MYACVKFICIRKLFTSVYAFITNIMLFIYLFIYLFIAKHLSCLEFALVSSSTIITNIKIQT